MVTIRRVLAVILGTLGVAVVVPAPAEAATRLTYVNAPVAVRARWGINNAVAYLDRYAGSRAVFGSCHTGARCVVIREARHTACDRMVAPPSFAAGCTDGITSRWRANRVTIFLNPRLANTADRKRIAQHEVGHAYGLAWHHSSCVYMMYYTSRCPGGGLQGSRLTATDVARVRAN